MGNNNEQYLEYLEDYRNRENIESTYSNDPLKEESIDFEVWTEFISYYRYYIDEFACDILGLRLFPFQRLILRAMARYQNSMLIACRGLGKSYIVAVFYICVAILYPNIKLGIASGNSQQARDVIIQKIKGELSKNEGIAREIVNRIQNIRKDKDFDITDRIKVEISSNANSDAAIDEYNEYISKQVLADELKIADTSNATDKIELDMDDYKLFVIVTKS